MSDIEHVTDYGLGTHEGDIRSPLVLATFRSDVYHRHDHGGRIDGDKWTEDFVVNGWGMRPCRVCWPASHPRAEEPQS